MKIAILDDYQDCVRSLACFARLAGHDVIVLNQTFSDLAELAARLPGVEALVLIRERTRITRALLERLPVLRAISQTGRAGPHIDTAACTARGVVVLSGSGSPAAQDGAHRDGQPRPGARPRDAGLRGARPGGLQAGA